MKNHPMKLLVAYDGSAGARAALDDLQYAGLPHEAQVEVIVVSVADVGVPPYSDSSDAHPLQVASMSAQTRRARETALRAVEQMQAVATQGREHLCAMFPRWQVGEDARADSPAWGVLKKEDEWQPDLTVIGAHGGPSLETLVFGSVAQKIVTQAKGSVRVGRSRSKAADAPLRLLIGLDGSPDAQHALDALCEREIAPGTQARVVTVLDSRMARGIATLLPTLSRWLGESSQSQSDQGGNDDDECEDVNEFAWVDDMVEAAVKQLCMAGLSASGTVREGDAKSVLLAEAESWEADCIFIGASGLVGSSRLQTLERFLLGSTATAVASRAACSVEIGRAASGVPILAPQGDNS